ELERLEDEAEVAAAEARQLVLAHGGEVLAVDHHRAAGRPVEAGDQRQQGRLAAARRTGHSEQLAVGDREVDPVEHREAARAVDEIAAQPGDLDHDGSLAQVCYLPPVRFHLPLVLFLLIGCKGGDDRERAAPAPPAAVDHRPAVVFLGDSLTAGLGLPLAEAVPARVAARIDRAGLPLRVINAGRSGDTSAGGLARLGWYLRAEVGLGALIVNLGSNDAIRGLPIAELEKNLTAIVTRAKAAVP